MIEKVLEAALKAVPWFFSGIGNGLFGKKNSNLTQINIVVEPNNISYSRIQETEEKPYSVELGTRLKGLREDILKLSKPKMRDFYGYATVTELEDYESGKVEFPQRSIDKLINFFFVNKDFIENGDSRIFRSISVDSEEVRELLKSGFKIDFLCSPSNREWLNTLPVFFKDEGDYMRIIVAGSAGYSMSNGWGYNDIATVIREMLRTGMRAYDAAILKVSEQTWQQLELGTYYSTNPYFGFGRDSECQGIFEEWFEKLENEMYPERYESISNFCEAVFGSKEKIVD